MRTGNPPEKYLELLDITAFCSGVFPKPTPGSRIIPSLRTPASTAAWARERRKERISSM